MANENQIEPTRQPLKAEVVDGRLVVSIGLDTLDALRLKHSIESPYVDAKAIADYLVSDWKGGAPILIERAIVDAACRAESDYEESQRGKTEV